MEACMHLISNNMQKVTWDLVRYGFMHLQHTWGDGDAATTTNRKWVANKPLLSTPGQQTFVWKQDYT